MTPIDITRINRQASLRFGIRLCFRCLPPRSIAPASRSKLGSQALFRYPPLRAPIAQLEIFQKNGPQRPTKQSTLPLRNRSDETMACAIEK